jgi:hypothetical protein
MDPGSRSKTLTAATWYRAVVVWMIFMLFETAHGVVRELFIAPVIGGLRARQIGVPAGCAIAFAVAWFAARWLGAHTRRQQLIVGLMWVALTLVFEFAIGRALGIPWQQLLADYNPARGGLMVMGLVFMFVTPMLVARHASRDSSK